jgi:hypothetical protein
MLWRILPCLFDDAGYRLAVGRYQSCLRRSEAPACGTCSTRHGLKVTRQPDAQDLGNREELNPITKRYCVAASR